MLHGCSSPAVTVCTRTEYISVDRPVAVAATAPWQIIASKDRVRQHVVILSDLVFIFGMLLSR